MSARAVRVAVALWLGLCLAAGVAACDGDGGPAVAPPDGPPGGKDAGMAGDTAPGRDGAAGSDTAPWWDGGGLPDAPVPDASVADAPVPDGSGPPDAPARSDLAHGSDPVVCPPPPPDDLVSVEVRDEGRFHVVAAFPAEGLAAREVRVWLPAGYDAEPGRRYPVLYLHDGQNLFDPARAAFGAAWEVDEAVDALVAEGAIPPLVVVGVDNTPARVEEYRAGPDPTADDGSAAAAYRTFLAERLKPWVDARYRTLCGRADTALAGSSMGGVASLAHALHYPEVWGRVGAFSSAFWYGNHELPAWLADHAPTALPDRLWLDVGTAESTTGGASTEFALDTRAVRDRLLALGYVVGRDLGYREEVGAVHNEDAWARRLPDALRFLFGPARPAAPAPEAIALEPFAAVIPLAGSGTELAVQADLGGVRLTLPNAGFTFVSAAPTVASVRADGHVTPFQEGDVRLTASRGALEADATVRIVSDAVVTFRVTVPPETPPDEEIMVRGNLAELGAWNDDGPTLTPLGDGRHELTIALPPGATVRYKYTRGPWTTVEKGPNGEELSDRTVLVTPGAVFEDVVARWADL